MEFTIILIVIIWIVIPVIAKNSQKKAKAEEERRRAMRQQAPQPQHAQQPIRTTPLAPTVRPAQTSMQNMFEGAGSLEGMDGPVFEGELPHEVVPDLATARTTLKEAKTSITHTVTVSSESGHAHEETSASGVAEDCPPEKAAAKPSANAAHGVGETAFVWSAAAVRNGLVMAEILGPCLANRD